MQEIIKDKKQKQQDNDSIRLDVPVSQKPTIKKKFAVKPIKPEETHDWLLKKHYAHRLPNIIYAFGLYDNDLQGVCTFGMTANNNLNEIVDGIRTIELNRLVINEDLGKNVLSFFVATALKQLPQPMIIISYADSGHGHHGYIYQATNWLYTGMGKGDYEFKKDGKQYHRKNIFDKFGTGNLENAVANGYEVVKVEPKYRYIYILADKKQKSGIISQLPFSIEPYPKGANQRYDASYVPNTQQTLF